MNKKQLEKVVIDNGKTEEQAPFEFEYDTKIRGSLFLRRTGKAEFYPSVSRDGKGGMTTTERRTNFTVQESQTKIKVTLSLPKQGLTFATLMQIVTKLVNHLQKSKLV